MKNQPFIEAYRNFRVRNTPETLRYFYHPDHIGSTSWVTDSAKNGIQYCEYLPFGEPFLDQRSTTWNSRYTFSGKERDGETGYSLVKKLRFFSSLAFGNEKLVFHYAHCLRRFGARYYNSDISIWLSVDPMSDERSWISPYNYCQNNPVRLVDPTGALDWKPDQEGNLIAESGDNAQTLAQYQGISYSEALKQHTDQGYTVNSKGILNLKVGDKVKLDNVYTESIENSTSDYTFDNATAGTSTTGPTPEDYYNCWGSTIAGSQNQKIEVGVGIPSGTIFDTKLSSDYNPTTESNAKFGKTILRFADASGVQHGAVYYGKNKSGEIYVYTKNGWYLKPEVMKLSNLMLKIPSYGTVQGINTSESGYYDYK